ncbi:MAG: hypothetical protein GW858_10660 [Sphingomonadales bacterium]|nr:hypothetical protein [Sphingomonadales bacterium]
MNTNTTKTESGIASDSGNEFSADTCTNVTANSPESVDRFSGDEACDEFAASPMGDFATALERDARNFAARSKSNNGHAQRPLRILVCDLEFIFDRERYAAYADSEGEDAEKKLRWAFHRIAAAAWMVMRFDPCSDVPVVEETRTIARDDADEPKIVSALFDAMTRYPGAVAVTWGGEFKDLAALRRCAGEFGLLLPNQLRNLHPHANERLDLCAATSVLAASMHLPEYAHATGIPTKPWPAKYIGTLVVRGDWKSVREQALGDVLTTSVVAMRHLASLGTINCHPQRSLTAIAEAAAEAMPSSQFVRNAFAPWARAQAAASRLKGTVIRAGVTSEKLEC